MGNYYEDFDVGEEITHPLSKTIFESDNNLFSLLTMNHHPVHTNIDYCFKQKYQEPLVVGTLVLSIVVGITVPEISGKAVANLEYNNIKHLGPVFINDTLYARTEVIGKRESKSKPEVGIIKVKTTAFNQNQEDVLELRRTVMIKKKEDNND